jgi:hypothetical protein
LVFFLSELSSPEPEAVFPSFLAFAASEAILSFSSKALTAASLAASSSAASLAAASS